MSRTSVFARLSLFLCISVLWLTPAHAGAISDLGQKAEAAMASDPLAALESLDQAVDQIWSASPLLMRKALFVNSASGYGIYDERQNAIFKVGEPLLVYGEPVGFAYGKNGLGGLEISLVVDFILVGEDGAELISRDDFAAFILPVRYRNREFQITLTLNLTGLPVGKYVGKFKLRDKYSDKTNQFELPFEVAG